MDPLTVVSHAARMDKKLKDAAVGTGALAATLVVGPVAAVVKPGADIVQFLWGRHREETVAHGLPTELERLGYSKQGIGIAIRQARFHGMLAPRTVVNDHGDD